MPTLPVYSLEGTQTGELEVSAVVFGVEPNQAVLHQVVVAELAARRQGTADTKTRGEVAGSTRKLWRQKGTGRARTSDRRAPHKIHGGVAMGPHPRSHRQRVSRALKAESVRSALSAQLQAGCLTVVEPLALPEAKTKALKAVLDSLGVVGRALLVIAEPSEMIWRCGRNLPGLSIRVASDVTALELLTARKIVITTEAVPALEARLS
jgi:large subunit ribosomal protein L4